MLEVSYWCVGHTKYALEVFYFHFLLNGTTSTRIAKQLLWGRVVSTRGGKGHNLPADLHMEHLNHLPIYTWNTEFDTRPR